MYSTHRGTCDVKIIVLHVDNGKSHACQVILYHHATTTPPQSFNLVSSLQDKSLNAFTALNNHDYKLNVRWD